MNTRKYAAPDGALFLILMKLQLWRTYGAKVMERFFRLLKVALPLAIVAGCLFGNVLHHQSGIFREFQAALLSVQWMLLACLAIWCSTFIFLTFSLKDLPLIGLLLIAIFAFFIGNASSQPALDAIVLLAGVTLGRGTQFLLQSGKRKAESGNGSNEEVRMKNEEFGNTLEIVNLKSAIVNFLAGLVLLLAFASWWHLDIAHNFYPGTRWTGLWDNPNIYGMLMGAGVVLAIGLLTENRKAESRKQKSVGSQNEEKRKAESGKRKLLRSLRSFAAVKLEVVLFIAAGMMGVGLFFSYSRGAWVGTAVGLLYLAKAHGKAESGKRKAKII